jgi:hypothetical protein
MFGFRGEVKGEGSQVELCGVVGLMVIDGAIFMSTIRITVSDLNKGEPGCPANCK